MILCYFDLVETICGTFCKSAWAVVTCVQLGQLSVLVVRISLPFPFVSVRFYSGFYAHGLCDSLVQLELFAVLVSRSYLPYGLYAIWVHLGPFVIMFGRR